MAGWDKIRAAAQRPDCIFSAFPDGEAGAMYHPRSSADEYLKLTNIKCENGEFVSHTAASSATTTGGVIISGKSFNATFLVKFYLDIEEGTAGINYSALLSGGSIGSHNSGMGVQGQAVTNGVIYLSLSLRYDVEENGTITTSYKQCGPSPKITVRQWHTAAISIDFEKKTHIAYLDGAKYGTYTLPAGNLSFSAHQSLANSPPRAFEMLHAAKGRIKGKYAMIFNRAMSDEEILYLMED